MHKEIIKCNGMSEEQINNKIAEYVKLGWEFVGISEDFPPNYSWIHLHWNSEEPPIYPDITPNN